MRGSGLARFVRDSQWRQRRLLILCYHGVSQFDEHLWRPALYMPCQILQRRLKMLERGQYNVLSLEEGLRRLQAKELPPRSVVITFDDGGYDFYSRAYPALKEYGFPVTVYQTTYYSTYQKPIFNLICSYMLWKRRGSVIHGGRDLGLDEPMDLRTESNRNRITAILTASCEVGELSGIQKDHLARRLAKVLDLDYEDLLAKRIFQLMSPTEIGQLATAGVDFQLHTHRHRVPNEEVLFRKEIRDNRQILQQLIKDRPVHFCYPSGVYQAKFLPWLRAEEVVSATTCDTGLASSKSNILLLPRLIDTSLRNDIEFESWLTGVGEWLALRRVAKWFA